ncbi:hypothetical protein ACHAQJ_005963 [Trichoderma viride]
MRVAMLFILVSIKLGFPALYKIYEFLKALFRPCRGDCRKGNKGVRFTEPSSHIRVVFQSFSRFF